MSKITQSARGETCTIRIDGYCNHNTETTVFAHANGVRFGHGMGHKVSDILGAYACSDCHDIVDGRQRCNTLTREQIELAHCHGVFETLLKLREKGLL